MYKAIAFKVHVNSIFNKGWTVLTKTMLAPAFSHVFFHFTHDNIKNTQVKDLAECRLEKVQVGSEASVNYLYLNKSLITLAIFTFFQHEFFPLNCHL